MGKNIKAVIGKVEAGLVFLPSEELQEYERQMWQRDIDILAEQNRKMWEEAFNSKNENDANRQRQKD